MCSRMRCEMCGGGMCGEDKIDRMCGGSGRGHKRMGHIIP